MKPIKGYSYRDLELFKYENARVKVFLLPTDNYGIELKILSEDTRQRTIHSVDKNKIVTTGIKVSKEAALSIMIGLQNQLRKNGII